MALFAPDRYYTNVQAVDLADLRARGIRALLLDVDNTLLPQGTSELKQELRDWTAHVSAEGFKLCIVSNNWHQHVQDIASALGLPVVGRAIKPLPYAFKRAMRLIEVTPAETAVIGDQLFTDVLGGNLLGLTTVLVVPLSQRDLPHTVLLRLIERRIMADREPLA